MAAGWGRGRALPHWAPLLILVLTVPGFSPSPTFGSPPDTLSAVAQGIPGSQIAAGGPLEDLIVELRVGRIARQTIIAALDLDHVLIPARPLFELLEIRSSIADDGSLRAVRQPDGTDLYVDGQLGLARVGDLALPHEQVIVRQAGGELYLWTELIASLLNVRVEVDLAELTVTIDPADELPVGRRVARERARAARHGGGSSAIADRVLAEDRTPFAGAVADWGVSLPDVGSMGASAYALRLGARVLGGGLDLRQSGAIRAQQDFAGSWIGAWPVHWGWRQLRLGSVIGTGPEPRSVNGIAISSSPFIRPLAFSESEVTGWLAPGWEVELYRNGELVDFGYADERGFYMLKTPIDYGENPIELRAYGPNGEMRELTRALPVAADRLPPGEVEYEATFGACDGGECDQTANLDLRYGVSDRWTVRAGTETFARSGSDLIHPYGIVSGLLGRDWLVRAEGTAGARAKLGIGYEPNPDLRLYAEHERFAQGTRAPILTPPGQRSHSRWTVFYRPDPHRASTFLVAGGQQAMAEHGADLRLNAGVASQLHNVRWNLEWREDHLGLGSGIAATVIAANASTALRMPVPMLNGLFLRGTAELDCRRGGLERLSLLLGRTLSPAVRAELTTGWVRAEGGFGISLAISATGTGVHSVGRVSQLGNGHSAASAFAEGSVLWNESAARVEVANGRTIGRGGVSGTVFIDENANGWLDPSEPRLPDIKVLVGSQAVRTDALGRYSAWDLGAFEAADVAIDMESMPSPLLVPSAALSSVFIQPNGFRSVDLPVARGVELMGRVLRSGSVGDAGLGSVRVTLRHQATGRVHETLTFTNGEFYLMGLPAGDYDVSIPADVLKLLGLEEEVPTLTLNVPKASDRSTQLPELLIRLRPVAPATAD